MKHLTEKNNKKTFPEHLKTESFSTAEKVYLYSEKEQLTPSPPLTMNFL